MPPGYRIEVQQSHIEKKEFRYACLRTATTNHQSHYPTTSWIIINGVMYTIGSCSTSMYMFALCLYSVMKIKKRSRRRTSCCRGRRAGDRPTIFMTMPMTDQDFVRNIEKFIHPSIILFTATLCIAGLVTKSINSTVLGISVPFPLSRQDADNALVYLENAILTLPGVRPSLSTSLLLA